MKFNRIYVEITNKCNLRCAFCTIGSRQPAEMSAEAFSDVLRKIRPFTDYIYLHVQGEPLVHPEFGRILSLCDESGIQVQIVTNGTLPERFPLLFHSCVRKVSFSVQSIEYQSGNDPEIYIKEILSFCREASRRGKPYCEIRFWRDDQLSFPATGNAMLYIKSEYDLIPTSRKNSFRLMENVYLSISNSFTWPSMNLPENDDSGYCLGALRQLAVLADGTVVPCCLDAEGIISFGNLFSSSLEEILAGTRYTKMREGLQNGRLTE